MGKSQVWLRQAYLSDHQDAQVQRLVSEARDRLEAAARIVVEAVGSAGLRPFDKIAVTVGEAQDATLIATPATLDGEDYTECVVYHADMAAAQVEVCDAFRLGRPTPPPEELTPQLSATAQVM